MNEKVYITTYLEFIYDPELVESEFRSTKIDKVYLDKESAKVRLEFLKSNDYTEPMLEECNVEEVNKTKIEIMYNLPSGKQISLSELLKKMDLVLEKIDEFNDKK